MRYVLYSAVRTCSKAARQTSLGTPMPTVVPMYSLGSDALVYGAVQVHVVDVLSHVNADRERVTVGSRWRTVGHAGSPRIPLGPERQSCGEPRLHLIPPSQALPWTWRRRDAPHDTLATRSSLGLEVLPTDHIQSSAECAPACILGHMNG